MKPFMSRVMWSAGKYENVQCVGFWGLELRTTDIYEEIKQCLKKRDHVK